MGKEDSFIWKSGKKQTEKKDFGTGNIYYLNTDGGIVAKPNQASGQAAIAAVLKNSKNSLFDVSSRLIGWVQDHHIAEYRALIEGLRLARGHRINRLEARVDSRLVVQQLGEKAKVKKPHLVPLHAEALAVVQEFPMIRIKHVPRKDNAEADALCNRALGR